MAGLDVSVEGKVLTFKVATESRAAASVKPGKYTLTIKDKNKKYADVFVTMYQKSTGLTESLMVTYR